jgi:hypothetical protein
MIRTRVLGLFAALALAGVRPERDRRAGAGLTEGQSRFSDASVRNADGSGPSSSRLRMAAAHSSGLSSDVSTSRS